MQDLQVTDILPQMITLSEAYIQASRPLSFCMDSINAAELLSFMWNIHSMKQTIASLDCDIDDMC